MFALSISWCREIRSPFSDFIFSYTCKFNYIFVFWQDYQTRAAIKDCDGLSPMLELLKSEFSIIQKLALLALDRASQDGNTIIYIMTHFLFISVHKKGCVAQCRCNTANVTQYILLSHKQPVYQTNLTYHVQRTDCLIFLHQ